MTDVYVEPGARGVGVGEAMLDQVVAWCDARRLHRHRRPGAARATGTTKNFFESFGFTARAIVVHRRLR